MAAEAGRDPASLPITAWYPARNLARANVLGVIAVVTLYLSLNVAYLWVLTPQQVAASPALAAEVARTVAGTAGARFVALLIIVSSLGFLAVVILTGPRLYYATAADGLFFGRAGRLHPRFGTPANAVLLQTGLALLVLCFGAFDRILSFIIFSAICFLALSAASLFRLKEPVHRWWYPAAPILFLLQLLLGFSVLVYMADKYLPMQKLFLLLLIVLLIQELIYPDSL